MVVQHDAISVLGGDGLDVSDVTLSIGSRLSKVQDGNSLLEKSIRDACFMWYVLGLRDDNDHKTVLFRAFLV